MAPYRYALLWFLSVATVSISAPASQQQQHHNNTAASQHSSSNSSSNNNEPQQRHQKLSKKAEHLLRQLHHYETAVPTLVDHNGHFVSYDVTHNYHKRQRRKRRSAEPQEHNVVNNKWIFYKLSAYGIEFHFNLTLNRLLLSADYVAEFWDEGGSSRRYYGHSRHCHYMGHISNSRFSRVALSNCFGLHGNFATEQDEYFVEPLWSETEYTENEDLEASTEGHLHVVYKRSAIKPKHNESECGVSDAHIFTPPWWSAGSPISNNILKSPVQHKQKDKKWWTSSFRRRRRRSRRSISSERHVETLLVVDKAMVAYHGKLEIEPYVLTVMNIVANLYHDHSIGNAINILVTRVILLTEDQPGLEINHHADKSLESFCRWQESINSKSIKEKQDVAHHDNAVLLTRYDICTYKNQPCGTLGLAPVAGMCEPDRSCNINEDIGLATAFTIAHEVGHNFGMQHDGTGNACGTPGHEPAKIMAAELTKNTEPFSWSACSREYITGFLDSGRGRCLNNNPPKQDFEFPTQLPGELQDVNVQCRYQYGSHSRHCKYEEEVCRELWCIGIDGTCVTNNIPAAEGSKCRTEVESDGWCYQGLCVKAGWKPSMEHGSWGEWSDWGSCSRTCGGGVEFSERFCENPIPTHGGKYCTGERKRYRSCNIQECPINSTDFREVQCSRFDELPFRGKLYKWIPFRGAGQMKPCALNCLAVGYNFYTERAQKVVDGTRCFPDSFDMCINGECRHVGCDGILGSEAVEDKCRVCGGDGSTCGTVSGKFVDTLENGSDSYHEVVRIPQGAVHIRVVESVISRNYLALKSAATDKYYINGAWTIDWPWKFEVANTIFHYERPTDQPESLRAIGPTSEDLVVMILLQENNHGVEYQYNMMAGNGIPQNASTDFVWQYTPWSQCSRTCAKGVSRSVGVCVRKDDRTLVKNRYCMHHIKPNDKTVYCNTEPCPPEWELGDWNECSKTCGGGMKTRSVSCFRRVDEREKERLTHEHCLRKRPESQQECNKDECPPHWATDSWSRCHPYCGQGSQSRSVYCVSAEGSYLLEKYCDPKTRPEHERECTMGECPPPFWVTGAWAECTAKCGRGEQVRSIVCRTSSGDPSDQCDASDQPSYRQECYGACELAQTDGECVDVNKVAYCPLVVKFQFCNRPYFRQMCCKTCRDAGL